MGQSWPWIQSRWQCQLWPAAPHRATRNSQLRGQEYGRIQSIRGASLSLFSNPRCSIGRLCTACQTRIYKRSSSDPTLSEFSRSLQCEKIQPVNTTCFGGELQMSTLSRIGSGGGSVSVPVVASDWPFQIYFIFRNVWSGDSRQDLGKQL